MHVQCARTIGPAVSFYSCKSVGVARVVSTMLAAPTYTVATMQERGRGPCCLQYARSAYLPSYTKRSRAMLDTEGKFGANGTRFLHCAWDRMPLVLGTVRPSCRRDEGSL